MSQARPRGPIVIDTGMAHYHARGQLRFAETRVAAVDRAATRYTESKTASARVIAEPNGASAMT